MRRKNSYNKVVGNYFFNIKMGYQNTILISRKNKAEAEYAFSNYLKQNKECEWLGKWTGKEYTETKYTGVAG